NLDPTILNNYAAASPVVLFTVTKPTVEKTLLSASTDNNADTLSSDSVVIGETVTYDLAISIPASTINNNTIDGAGMIITDVLPIGLQYVDGSAQINLTNFGVGSVQDTSGNAYNNGDTLGNNTPADVSFDSGTGILTIKLGQIVTPGSGDVLHIEYAALV